jgi:drug/metabolite transporter (DMT)-like permease
MEGIFVVTALFSAVLHAGWNAAVKASRHPAEVMAAQMVAGAVIVLPCLIWTGLPAPEAWMWIGFSTTCNILAVTAVLRAYQLGGFGVVYPVTRAVSVLLVVPLSTWLAGDRLGPAALSGVFLVTTALALLARGSGAERSFTPRALGWTLAAGVMTSIYILCDARGVRLSGSPWAYGFTVSVTNAIAMSWRLRKAGSPWRLLRRHWTVAVPTSIAAILSYVLILWVWTHAPVAPASALRDTSAVFALLIAIAWLKEPFTRTRMAAVLLAAAAIPLLRLA